MNPELQALLDGLAKRWADTPQQDRNELADWLLDHPHLLTEVVTAMIRRMPDLLAPVLGPLLMEGLSVQSEVKREHISSGTILARVVVNLYWHGQLVSSADIPMR